MLEESAIAASHLSDAMRREFSISQASLAKLGFVRFDLADEFEQRLSVEGETGSNALKEYVEEIYSLLEKSPHIMEIRPAKKELFEEFSNGQLGIRSWALNQSLSLSRFLSLRVVLPKRKRDDLGVFPWSWNPEEFELFFDGAQFVVVADVETIPVVTDLGQIAREFLVETLAPSKILKHVDGIGPTPIHPEFYFLRATQKSAEPVATHLPSIRETKGDLVVTVPDGKPIDAVTKPLLQDVSFALSYFYEQRVADREYSDAVDALEELDQQLNSKVASYFAQGPLRRLFSGESRSIRQLIATMHGALREISFSEKLARQKEDEARRAIAETTFLKHLGPYFDEHMASDVIFDREADLSSMNFAATETNNFAVVQATVVAALLGAIVGGVLAVIAK